MSDEATNLISDNSTPATPAEAKVDSSSAHAKATLEKTKTAAKDAYSTGKDQLSKAAKDLSDAASAKYADLRTEAAAKGEIYKGKAQEALSEAQVRAKTCQSDAEQYIRDNPLQAVGAALGVGFLIGILLRK